ncbi:type I restriction-modification system subunit M/S [Nocardia miyunensis]|uniref:type I restriction-modification system subunit M/S n=1 Tax=Nocardia miyunensis TaxID=282684 RepID=UPI0008303B8D|nr:type I restriction-modification system subunit M/S [Nocardia miyunensis]
MTESDSLPNRPVYVHKPDIARYAGIGRPTVTTWETRHSTFPRPVGHDDRGDYYRLDEVIVWLSDRPVPESARDREQEPVGITYGQRASLRVAAEQATRTAAVRTEAGAKQREKLLSDLLGSIGIRLRADAVSEADYLLILLCLIFLRVCDNDSWHELLKSAEQQSGVTLLREIGWRVDQALRAHAIAPDMRPLIECLSPRHPYELRKCLKSCGSLGPAAFSSLVSRFAVTAELGSREYFTPPALARLMADLAAGPEPVSGVVHDPYTRGGELFHALLSRGVREAGVHVQGTSVTARTMRVAAMWVAITHGPGEFRQGSMSPWNDREGAVRADIVVTNPPFNNRSDQVGEPSSSAWEFEAPPPPHNDNFAWLLHVVASLTPDGVAVALMPAQAAVSADRQEAEVRRAMVEAGAVRAVIALPDKMAPKSDAATSVWILTKGQKVPHDVLLIDARALGVSDGKRMTLPDSMVTALVERYRTRQDLPTDQVVAVAEQGSAMNASPDTIRAAGYLLRPSDYVRSAEVVRTEVILDGIRQTFGDFGRRRNQTSPAGMLDLVSYLPPDRSETDTSNKARDQLLIDVCDIQPGPSYDLMPKDDEHGEVLTVPVLKRQHLREYRVIAEGAELISAQAARRLRKYLLEPDDILLVRTGAMIAPAIVGADQLPMMLDNSLVRLRVRDRERVDPLFLLTYLSSDRILTDIAARATGTAAPTLSKGALGRQPIALPSINEQHRIGEAIRAVDDQVAELHQLAKVSAHARAALVDALATGVLKLNDLPSL